MSGAIKKKKMSSSSESDGSSDDNDDERSVNIKTTNSESNFYSTLSNKLTTQSKIEIMNDEILKLKHQVVFYQLLNNAKNGTTKKGRRLHRLGGNRGIMMSIRDVMADVVFPYCKFIGKVDLQTTAEGSIADVLMRRLQVGNNVRGGDSAKVKFKLEWWGRNCELVEQCLVDHKTKSTQNMKKRYISGKDRFCCVL